MPIHIRYGDKNGVSDWIRRCFCGVMRIDMNNVSRIL
jgi:hypothetical protein